MEFDYPGWGHSAGWPRQDINPWTRVKVVDAALAHLKSLPQVNARKIVLWGTSFGGGHVVDIATQHPEILGAIIQVPMLDGLATVMAVPFFRLLRFGIYGLLDLFKPGSRIHLPTLARPGEFGSMDRDGAWNAMELGITGLGNKKYDNRVTARSLLTMAFYRPWTRLKKVDVPMLIVGATRDTVAPFVAGKVHAVRNRHLLVIEIDANHFDPYFEPVFAEMIEHQLAFLSKLELSAASAGKADLQLAAAS
jgi:pimeloyl-ACP methyl ester carboxylesterase